MFLFEKCIYYEHTIANYNVMTVHKVINVLLIVNLSSNVIIVLSKTSGNTLFYGVFVTHVMYTVLINSKLCIIIIIHN